MQGATMGKGVGCVCSMLSIPPHFALGALRGPLEHFSKSGQHPPTQALA